MAFGTMRFVLYVCLVAFVVIIWTQQSSEGVKLQSFPGFEGQIPSPISTGYKIVCEEDERRLFYYFVESERNPSKDPLILWLTGGPGCTSFTALAYELGPLQFDLLHLDATAKIPKLILNPFSWTKVSNIIFLDSPAGTGFSYCKNLEDFETGDIKAVNDIYTFLQKWYEEFPEFRNNELYIGGDSYSGLVVPVLSLLIHHANEDGILPSMNLKGYIVGNGKTDPIYDDTQIPFAHGMALISDEFYEATRESCNGSYANPPNALCKSMLDKFEDIKSGLNTANILDSKCYDISVNLLNMNMKEQGSRRSILSEFNPCPPVDKYELSVIWAGNSYVRETIHAETEEITGVWRRCTPRYKSYSQDFSSVIKHHRELTLNGYRALIYSGDHDLIVPFIGTQGWIRSLNYTIIDDWRQWYAYGQVGGYTRTYEHNLTFATVKGAGHTAPEYIPSSSFIMFKRWISKERL